MASFIDNLSYINALQNDLKTINSNLSVIDERVDRVDNNVKIIYDEVAALAQEFGEYVTKQMRENALIKAQQEIIRIRQELEKRFGHHAIVRRTTTGILQANDIGIVKKDTISNATEEMMLTTPGYWLSPCLVALAAWINDQPELAERALREGIRRNDEKTSLFFALICRRANRKSAALKWLRRYLANQDEENLDRKAIVILDAFASGLLGADSEGVVSRQISEWLEHLADKPGFVEQQTSQWVDAINLKRKPYDGDEYPYLSKHSKTWPALKDIMEGAMLHAEVFDYFTTIFEQEASTDSLKAQLDEILNTLVSEFDDEEVPLKKEEKYNQFIIDFKGDEDRARKSMSVEQTAFEERKDFTQLLTDSAMKPESSHAGVSTQKFAISLSKEWITNAYNDVVAQNRMKIPNEIQINVGSFNDKTTDGQNEMELIGKFNYHVEREKQKALSDVFLSGFDMFCLWGGLIFIAMGLVAIFTGMVFFGFIIVIAGIGLVIKYNSKRKTVKQDRLDLENQYEKRQRSGTQIIRATLAEVVDFRAQFAEKDAESQKVLDLLERLSPEQYVRKLSDTPRKIIIQ